ASSPCVPWVYHSAVSGGGARAENARPRHEPDAECGVEPSRQKQYGADADKTKRTGFTRRQRDAVHREPPFSRERLHAAFVTSPAGPADCDNCIRAFGSHGDTEPPAAVGI